jgi:hypothetical protein
MSKKPSFEYICSLVALIEATYSGGSAPCGRIVPMIDVKAREMRSESVNLSEQNKSHTDVAKFLSVVANGISKQIFENTHLKWFESFNQYLTSGQYPKF